MPILGIDIGATKTIFLLMKEERIKKVKKTFTPAKKDKLIKVLKENIQALKKEEAIKGIGIGLPGPLDPQRKVVLNPPNLICLSQTPLATIIEKEFQVKTRMENDANCFTLGETLRGGGRGGKRVFGITLGTGVGGGMVVDGKIWPGAFGSAGEIGHLTIKYDGPRCCCGNRGCLEEYCSERFFLKKGFSSEEIKSQTQKKDKKILKIYKEYGKYLGIGLSNLINLLDPEVIVLGGGIANGYSFFIKEVKAEIKRRAISPFSQKKVKIKKSQLGEVAGALGAALLVNF